MPKQPFTNMTITALKPRHSKYELFDNRVGGLSVQVYPSGKKSFCLNYRVAGSPTRKRMRFGDPKVMTINEARATATQLKEKARSGIDPNEERKEAVKAQASQQENTIANLADAFVERYCIGTETEPNLKTWKEYKRTLEGYVLPRWRNRQVESIARKDITALLDAIEDANGPYQANRVLAVVRKMFNWLLSRGVIEQTPVSIGIARKEKPRDRVLTDDEIVEFWKGCEKSAYPFGKLFQLLLITGQRREEVANMRWSEIDFNENVWSLPAHSNKMSRKHLVPLSPMAVDLLNSLPRFENCDLLFPSKVSNDRPVSGHSKAKNRICQLETAWQLNDLRRTVRTNLGRLEVDYIINNKVLGHIDQSVEGHYDHHDYLKQKRDALEKWAVLLTSIIEPRVISIDKARSL
jgi:integrase